MKVINLTCTFNTRDLGNTLTIDGRRIKENTLIRSGVLKKLSDDDIKTLKEHNLKTIIDFRSEKEFVERPDVKIDGVTYLNFPALKKNNLPKKKENDHYDSNLLQLVDKDKGGMKLLLTTYHDLVTSEEGIKAYQDFFKALLDYEGAFLWHCSQGKDRAGLAAFFLLYILGVPMQDCIDDYLYTNNAMKLKIKELTPIVLKMSNNDTSLLPILKDVFEAKIEYLNESLNTINLAYGSLDNFIINVLKADVDKLKEKFLH